MPGAQRWAGGPKLHSYPESRATQNSIISIQKCRNMYFSITKYLLRHVVIRNLKTVHLNIILPDMSFRVPWSHSGKVAGMFHCSWEEHRSYKGFTAEAGCDIPILSGEIEPSTTCGSVQACPISRPRRQSTIQYNYDTSHISLLADLRFQFLVFSVSGLR